MNGKFERSYDARKKSRIGGDDSLRASSEEGNEAEESASFGGLLKSVSQPIDSYYWLMSSKTFWVQQVPPLYGGELELALHTASPLYDVYNERGNCVFKAVNQENFRGRTESPYRSFKFNVVDSAGVPFVDVIRHRNTLWNIITSWLPCWCFGPIKNEATIINLDGDVRWLIRQEFTLGQCRSTCYKAYKVGSDRCDVNIEGPGDICALGFPHSFTRGAESSRFIFKDASNTNVVAVIRKLYPLGKWPAHYSTCPLAVIFTNKAELKHRIIALGCAFFFDFMFFQRELE